MSFIEDIRKIKQSQEGPAFKIERDEANVALKEAILKKVKMGQNHIVLEITEIMRGLDINPGLIEVKIKGKMIPKDLNQEEIRVSTISSFLPVATTSNVEYQFSG